MNKYITILIAFVAMLFAVDAAAYTPPPAPAKGWYVVDQTGRMTPAQINNLNQKIDRISKATKNEFGILLLQDMGGNNIEDVANATYKAWGIGKRGLDNGALIVVSIKERKSRIETGKGSEGEIPDLRASDILKNNLNPHLKTGDFYGGFDQTIDAVSSFLESRRNQKAAPPPAPVATAPAPAATTHATPANSGCDISGAAGSSGGWIFVIVALGLIGFLVVRSYLRAKAEAKEAERLALEEARRRRQERQAKLEREARLEAARKLEVKTPVVPVPYFDRQVSIPPPPAKTPSVRPTVPRPTPRPVIHSSHVKPTTKTTPSNPTPAVVAGAGIAAAAVLAEAEARREREAEERRAEARRQREREEDERRAEERRARAQREEEERQARQREEESRQSSYSSYSSYSSDSSSSYDSGSSSSYDSGGSSDSGGGFGGGDSGGGGSSSDW